MFGRRTPSSRRKLYFGRPRANPAFPAAFRKARASAKAVRRALGGSSAERAAAIESGTGSDVTDYVAQDGSKNIAITAEVADLEAMQSMLAAPPAEVAARMEAHGVVQPLTVYIES